MKAGELRHSVALQSATDTRDAAGGVTKTWATYATVYGKLEVMRGKETLEAPGPISNHEIELTIRYNSTVALEHRAVVNTRTYEINSIDEWQDREIMQIMRCTEVKT